MATTTSIRNVGQDERRDCPNADVVERCRVDSASECVTGTSLTRHPVGTVGRDAAADEGGPTAVTCLTVQPAQQPDVTCPDPMAGARNCQTR